MTHFIVDVCDRCGREVDERDLEGTEKKFHRVPANHTATDTWDLCWECYDEYTDWFERWKNG
jgi:hypothetical protein